MSEIPDRLKVVEALSSQDLLGVLRDRFQKNLQDNELYEGIAQLHVAVVDLRRAQKEATETPTQVALASEEPVTSPESSGTLWVEKLKASEMYRLGMSSFRPGWRLGDATLGKVYPNADQSRQGSVGPAQAFPLFDYAIFRLGEQLSGGPIRHDTLHQEAVLMVSEQNYQNKKPSSGMAASLKREYPKYGHQFIDSNEGEVMMYSHPLSNTDVHGRSGNVLKLVMYFDRADSNRFLDEVEKNPRLVDEVLQGLFPNLTSPDQVARKKVSRLWIYQPTVFAGMSAVPLTAEFGNEAQTERYKKLPLDPPLGEE